VSRKQWVLVRLSIYLECGTLQGQVSFGTWWGAASSSAAHLGWKQHHRLIGETALSTLVGNGAVFSVGEAAPSTLIGDSTVSSLEMAPPHQLVKQCCHLVGKTAPSPGFVKQRSCLVGETAPLPQLLKQCGCLGW